MTAPPEQAEVAGFLRSLVDAEPLETHISLVFVGADTVWKLKKAVRLAFLDFTSLATRRQFTEREFELNRVAAPGLYQDVVPVVRHPDGKLALGNPGQGPVLDWVLRMARVPASDFLDAIAVRGGLTPDLLEALGDAIAAYHQALPPSPAQRSRTGDAALAAFRQVAGGNAQSALDAGIPEAAVQCWRTRILGALDGLGGWLAQREQDGFVRRAHGDLHLGNLCLWRGRPVPFDALEFDEAMATTDLGYDLAFLLMDLDQRAGRSAANRVLNRYVARNGDAALTHGLPPFLSLRAMIRAHVEAKRGNPGPAARYLSAAAQYLETKPALVLAIGGLPGSGKSTLARVLAPELGNAPGALVLRSDEIRKRQHGVPPEQRLPQVAYTDAASERVFAELVELAGNTATGGHAVVADATFTDARHRAAIETAARAADVRFIGLWLEAPDEELEARLAARRRDASDATVAVLRAVRRSNPEAGAWRTIDARELVMSQVHARQAISAVKV